MNQAISTDQHKIGYLAAMIDGEGFISISKGTTPAYRKDGRVGYSPRYVLSVAVTGTNDVLMKWLVENFGGNWRFDKKRQNVRWKRRCAWNMLGGNNKLLLLKLVLPHLVMKRRQAELGIELLEMNAERNPEKREKIRQEMLALNKRGTTVEANTQDFVDESVPRYNGPFLEPKLRKMIESELGCEFENDAAVTL